MNIPTLTGAGIVLRPLRPGDAPALFVALGDAEVQLYRRQQAHADSAETARYIEDTLARGYGWAITEDGDEALGRLALRIVDQNAGEFGIVLRRAAQRRGLGAKALALAEAFAFGTLGLRVLRAQIDAANEASLKLFARAGFASIAVHRDVRDNIIMKKSQHAYQRSAS